MSSAREDREGQRDNPSDAPDDANAPEGEARIERDRELLELLGEVIRMSEAWVRALESGDPFTADKHEAQCVAAMERFEAKRKRMRQNAASFEQTE
jgi:hypothetical protein